MNDRSQTLVVNLYGGPGTGKSTTAALTFGKLKVRGWNAELVHEYAKDLVWEERFNALAFQPYVINKQLYHVHRVLGKVDVVITDSPILLGMIYRGEGYTSSLGDHLLSIYDQWTTLDLFLQRDKEHHPYNPAGRAQTEEQAEAIDTEIENLLNQQGILFSTIPIMENEGTANAVVELVEEKLAYLK